MSHLIARPLTGDQIIRAFALMQGLYPSLSLNEWRKATEPGRECSGGELMSLQTVNGSIHAVFCCRETEDLFHGHMLLVDHVIVYDLPGRGEALRTVLRVVEQMARERGCAAIDVTLPQTGSATPAPLRTMCRRLQDEGYAEHGIRLRRSIETEVIY